MTFILDEMTTSNVIGQLVLASFRGTCISRSFERIGQATRPAISTKKGSHDYK